MAIICPTILAVTPQDFQDQSQKLSFAPRVQIDIADGIFAPSHTVNLNQVYLNQEQKTDLHLMIEEPREWLETAIALSPHMIILHAEAKGELLEFFQYIKKFGIKTGVAILPETQPEDVENLIASCDHCLIFGGKLGFQGGEAILSMLKKVGAIRAIKPVIEVGWDGGANADNIKKISMAGVNVIDAGSSVLHTKNPEESWKNLENILTGRTHGMLEVDRLRDIQSVSHNSKRR
jgi:ribulose-phosphate 3-epimerase